MRLGAYATTLLVSAFLLFSVQPMIARSVLPYWGGGSGVWTVSLLFFQSALLLGYLYAHLIARYVSIRAQAMGHSLLLLLATALLFAGSVAGVQTDPSSAPSAQLLWQLARHVGIPIVVLSATAPLLQHWFAQERGAAAYRLYAVSNVGSLLGLLAYPLALEPLLGLDAQAALWRIGYLVLAVLCIACASLAKRSRIPVVREAPPAITTIVLWIALSAAGVVLLLSVTTEITANLVPMPLLWVVPLVLYLLTFIWCFARDAAYSRRRWVSLFSLALLPTLWLPAIEPLVGVWPAVVLSCFALFCGCMICHGELARTKPQAHNLSIYYVFLAGGGALGSALINFAAPIVFDRNWDLAFALFVVMTLAGVCTIAASTTRASNAGNSSRPQRRQQVPVGAVALWALGLLAFAFIGTLPLRAQHGTVAAERSFYGTLSVVESSTRSGQRQRALLHGRIRHGAQNVGARALEPTLYFSRDSGVGIALQSAAYPAKRHIGVVGLGAGTLASYGRPDDRIRFYELDPLVVSFAERYFSFLSSSLASVTLIIGDGRRSLDQELGKTGSNEFDLLVIDAFNADAVPTHLLTREAFALYWQHLDEEGTLALNITNAFLDLGPVIQAHAIAANKKTRIVRAAASVQSQSGSAWMLVTNNPKLLGDPALPKSASATPAAAQRIWTDDYSNILSALR